MQTKKKSLSLFILFIFSIIMNIKSSEIVNQNKLPRTLYVKNLLKQKTPQCLLITQPIVYLYIYCALATIYDCIANKPSMLYPAVMIYISTVHILLEMLIAIIIKSICYIKNSVIKNNKSQNIKVENKNFEKKCLICMNDEDKFLYINNHCNHCYHKDCIKTWLEHAANSGNPDIFKG